MITISAKNSKFVNVFFFYLPEVFLIVSQNLNAICLVSYMR